MSLYRNALETWVGNIKVKADRVLDVGGGQLPISKRVKSWDVKNYLIADNDAQYKPDIFMDLNQPLAKQEPFGDDGEMAYIAGIIDGEGYIGIIKSKKTKNYNYSPQFGLNMKNPEGVQLIENRFGLNVRQTKTGEFSITATGQKLQRMLLEVYPYLRVKKREAELAILLRKDIDENRPKIVPRGGSQSHSKEVLDYREQLYQENKDLKFGNYVRADVLFCLEVFEYIYDPVTAHKNLWYLLKPGGVAYISYPTIYPLHNPPGIDYLRYSKNVIEKYLGMNFKTWEITPRIATDGLGPLRDFYSYEGMRAMKNTSDVFDIGYMAKVIK